MAKSVVSERPAPLLQFGYLDEIYDEPDPKLEGQNLFNLAIEKHDQNEFEDAIKYLSWHLNQ